jgi:hypothetical protein
VHPQLEALIEWSKQPIVAGTLFAVSFGLLVLSLWLMPHAIVRIPVDYFRGHSPAPRPLAIRVGKNLLGLVLVLAGVAMLVLPGQGVLTLLIGVVLLEFPGKPWLLRRIAGQPRVLAALNTIRERRGVPPLEPPPDRRGAAHA